MRIQPPLTDPTVSPWPGSPSEEFHAASRNLSTVKRFYKAHEIHYSAEVKQLAASAPESLAVGIPTQLSGALMKPEISLIETVYRRESCRFFASTPLAPGNLRSLLFYSCGVRVVERHADGTPVYRRNVANSGNLGSCEVFVIAHEVESLAPGIYHYDSLRGTLGLLKTGAFRVWLRENVLYQVELAAAPLTLVLVGAIGRLKQKYGDRGYRLALMDVGHVSQNLYLVATALGLVISATAGFIDDELDCSLGLDGLDYASLLVLAVGNAPSDELNALRQASEDN